MQPWSRMKPSASRSRSSVVMPGRTCSPRWARQAPRIFPEARIFSISSGRLSRNASILEATSGDLATGTQPAEDGQDGFGDLLDGDCPVDELDACAALLVVVEHRSGLGLVLAHA